MIHQNQLDLLDEDDKNLGKRSRSSPEGMAFSQEVLDIEQSMLLEAYTQFVSKVEQKPKESVEVAKTWLMGQLLQQGFQVAHRPGGH